MSTAAPPPSDSAPEERPDRTVMRAKRPRTGRGQRPMIWLVGLVLVSFAVANELRADAPRGALWPVFLAILAFLYLWWLSSLLFDLAFIWHRYIQADAAHRFLRTHVQRASFRPKDDPPTEPSAPTPTTIPPLSPSGNSPTHAPLRR